MVPLVFLIVDRRPLPPLRPGLLAHAVLLLAALFVVFGLDQPARTTLFYILFLPVVAIAAGYGFEAVVLALAATQVALILADQVWKMSSFEVTTLQGFLLVLSATGMTAGLLVSQRKHAEMLLRLQQEQQARLQQRGSLGELATLIAHEVNQPLTAASMYARMIVEAVARDMPSSQLETLAQKSSQQVARASDVVRKLRELVRLGRSARAACAVAEIIDESVTLFLQTAGPMPDIAVQVQVASDLPLVHADRTQVEQVLLNLLRNSVEAIRSRPGGGKIQITARRTADDRVEIVVADDGPGFSLPPDTLIDGLKSTKSEGLGVGLALSRTIVDLHHGDFEITTAIQGARVRFTLPIVSQPGGAP
jgi:signal transduction histidine kinase